VYLFSTRVAQTGGWNASITALLLFLNPEMVLDWVLGDLQEMAICW
jgi:hypothetical protein